MIDYIKLQEAGSDWSYNSKWGDQMEDAIVNWLGKSVPKSYRILDAGCGEGRGLAALRLNGFTNLTGIDITKEKVRSTLSKGIPAICSDIKNLPFKNDSFDVCFSSHTLEHTTSIKEAILSILKVSKILFYIVPINETKEFVKINNPSHVSPINHPIEFINIVKLLNVTHKYTRVVRLCSELWGTIERN